MASPVVADTTEGSVNSAGTSHAVTLPAGGAETDEYLVIMDIGSTAATLNALTDWTELLDENQAHGLKIVRYTGAGVPSNPTFTTTANTRSAWIAYRITGADKSTAPGIGTTTTGTSTTPNPPAVTPPSSKDYLFITFFGRNGEEADDDTWATAAPTNYTPSPPLQKACGIAGSNLGGMIAAASRQLTTGTAEDPGTFTAATGVWRAQTIMVHPAAATPVDGPVLDVVWDLAEGSAYWLKPNGEASAGCKSEWTSSGTSWDLVDDGVIPPTDPPTGDSVTSTASGQYDRLETEDFSIPAGKRIKELSMYTYIEANNGANVELSLYTDTSGYGTMDPPASVSGTGWISTTFSRPFNSTASGVDNYEMTDALVDTLLTYRRSLAASQIARADMVKVVVEDIPATPVDGPALSVKWDLAAAVDATSTVKWDLAAAVDQARTLKWDLAATVDSGVLDLLWDMRAAVDGTQLDALWDLHSAVNQPRTLVWDLRAAADSGLLDLTWDVRNPVDAAARTLIWDLYAAVARTRTLLWDVAAATNGPQLDLTWDVRAHATGSLLDLVWDLRAAVDELLTLSWDIAGADPTNPVDGPVLDAIWDMYAGVDRALTLDWDLAAHTDRQVALLWDLRSQVDRTVQLRWDVRVAVARSVSLLWDVRTPVDGGARSLLWDMYAQVARQLVAIWDLRAQTEAQLLELVWDLRTPVDADARTLLWDVRTGVDAPAATIVWDLLAEAVRGLVLRWDVEGSALAQPSHPGRVAVASQPGRVLYPSGAALAPSAGKVRR